MKTRFLLIIISILSLSIGCVKEEEDSECYTQMLLYFEQGEKSYEEEIARIRNPDGSWSTHEQCLEQKELTLTYLDEYKEAEAEVNAQTDYESCTAEEKRDILNTLERLIIEMESDAYTWYSCD